MASRHPNSRVNRSPLVQHKQYIVPITTPRERHSKCDFKPLHAHSRPSSAKIRSLVEKCDILQQDLENDKKLIVHISVDVVQTKEEYKPLCVEFGKKEDWHRIVGLSVMVDNIQRQFTELECKLVHYNAEISKLKETNNKLKRRLKQLDGRCIFIADKKQKLIGEQLSTPPKNLMKRAVQGVTISPPSQLRTADLQLNGSVESVKTGKSDIQVQFNQNQSELDNLITTERRLKENINGLQASHNTIKHDILKLKEKNKTTRSGRKHKQKVQKTATKQVYQMHTLQSSQSTNQLEAMTKDTDRISDVLKSETEVQDEAVQTECHEDAVIPQENLDVQICQASKSKVHVEDKGVNLKSSEASNPKVKTEDKEVQVECTETAIVPVPLGNPEIHVQVQTEDKGVQTACKEIAVMSQEDLRHQLTKSKDEHFALTNDFTTTADEGSVIKLRDEYRYMQHNLRAAAMREHKKLYDDISLSLADHCMVAYKNAKVSLFDELKNITDRLLYQLQISENSSQGNKLSQNYLLLIKSFRDDHKLSKDIKMKIEEALIKEYKAITNQAPKGIPKGIKEYYSTLAKFSWDCVARPIPLIMSTDYTKFDKELHEAGDNVDNEGKDVSYIYPVLLTSNNWPREVALKGKVSILLPTKFLPF